MVLSISKIGDGTFYYVSSMAINISDVRALLAMFLLSVSLPAIFLLFVFTRNAPTALFLLEVFMCALYMQYLLCHLSIGHFSSGSDSAVRFSIGNILAVRLFALMFLVRTLLFTLFQRKGTCGPHSIHMQGQHATVKGLYSGSGQLQQQQQQHPD